MHDVKSVSQLDTMPLFANNYRFNFKWQKQGSLSCLSKDGACTDLFENLSVNSLKVDLSNDITFNPPLFSLVNTFKPTQTGINRNRYTFYTTKSSEPLKNLETSRFPYLSLVL